jgi:hypothetical protein
LPQVVPGITKYLLYKKIFQEILTLSGDSNLFRDATGEEPSDSSTSSKNSDEFFSSLWSEMHNASMKRREALADLRHSDEPFRKR